MKKLSVLISVVMVLLMCSCNSTRNPSTASTAGESQAGTNEADKVTDVAELYEWVETDGGIEITKYLGGEKEIVVPGVIEHKKVVSVGTAFSGNVEIESLTLPESCETGNFENCDNLKYLAFPGCKSYDSFTGEPFTKLPENLETLILSGITSWFDIDSLRLRGWPGVENLEYLDLSGVSYFTKDPGPPENVPFKEINIPQMKYYTPMADDMTDGAYLYSELPQNPNWEVYEITDENFEDAMYEVFGTKGLIVNGIECK